MAPRPPCDYRVALPHVTPGAVRPEAIRAPDHTTTKPV